MTGCKRRCRHLLFVSGVTHEFRLIALIWHSKWALLILPPIKKNSDPCRTCSGETDRGWQTFANDYTYSLSWAAQADTPLPGVVPSLLNAAVICGFTGTESSSINRNYTLVSPGPLNENGNLDISVSIFLSSAFWCIHPCHVVWGQRLRQSSLTRLTNEMDSAGAEAWAECLCYTGLQPSSLQPCPLGGLTDFLIESSTHMAPPPSVLGPSW